MGDTKELAYPRLSPEELWDQDIESLVYVEESPSWPGLLVWQNIDDQGFTSTYEDYVSRHGLINEPFMIDTFCKRLAKDGYTVSFDANCQPALDEHVRNHAPLLIDGLDLRWPDGTKSELFDYQRYTLNRALSRATGATAADRFLLYGWGAGTGKAQPVTEPVLTPTGWRTMGDLLVGDEVIGSDGHPTRVTSIHPQGVRSVYRVKMNDGTFVRCDGEHLWNARKAKVKDRGQGRQPEEVPWKTLTTRELMRTTGAAHRRWQLPALEGVTFDARTQLPVDPYELGVYLGDGHDNGWTMRVCTDRWIAEQLHWEVCSWGARGDYTIVAKLPRQTRTDLKSLDLGGLRSWEKFVPPLYLTASAPDRLHLLQGLLDTDGHPMKDGGVEYSTTSPYLRDAVVDLVRGLGGRAHVSERAGSYTRNGVRHEARVNWRIHLNLTAMAFRLPRKADAWTPPTKYQPTKTIVSIVEEGVSEEQVCIVVDAPDNLYVTRGHTITHNSAVSAGGAQMLFNAGLIDVAVVMTMPTLKLDLLEFFQTTTPLVTVLADGDKTKRNRLWADPAIQVYVTNYEKAHWDEELVAARTAGKRVLFIFDEVAKILTDAGQTLARKALDRIMKGCTATCWPMTATAVDYSPFRYRDVFSLSLGANKNPLGTKKDFEDRYCRGKQSWRMKGRNGGTFVTTTYDWDHDKLHEVRHRIGGVTQNARRTDPGIRENFPDFDVIPRYVRLNADDRILYDVVKGWASIAREAGESRAAHLEVMRYICNTPAAVGATNNPVGLELAAQYPGLVNAAAARDSAKLEMFCDQLEQFRDARDKVVAFSKWTHLGLLLLAPELERRGIKFALHHGGLSARANQEAKTRFKTDPEITCLFSSDAGQRGLNLPEAIAEISYDCPYSWDTQNQRQSRMIRANSLYYDKRPRIAYIYVTQGTCEVEIFRAMMGRRRLAEVTTGTTEKLSISASDDDLDDDAMLTGPGVVDAMIFGEEG